jgi:hypothetical protein
VGKLERLARRGDRVPWHHPCWQFVKLVGEEEDPVATGAITTAIRLQARS